MDHDIPELGEAEFLAALREPLLTLVHTPRLLARVGGYLPSLGPAAGISESFDGMFTHVLVAMGDGRYRTFVIDNAAGLVRGYFVMAL